MERPRVGVIGASGYSGMVATRLLAAHPRFELSFCTSDKWAGDSVRDRIGSPVSSAMVFAPNSEAHAQAASVEALFLATSAEVSLALAGELLEQGKIVIDFSGAFRLDHASDFTQWYRLPHDEPELLSIAHYGLPEVFGRPRGALVANPGCYPTAALLALAPLLKAELIELDSIVVDGKSGVTGAGRQAGESFSFAEIGDDFRAYKVLTHQHTPEIVQVLSRVAKAAVNLTFTAHLLPIRRGLLCTCYARPRAGVTEGRVQQCLRAAYEKSCFVDVVSADAVSLSRVVGTNRCCIGASANENVVVVTSAIDNLLKGAAGQAVQNLNLMYAFDENAGLDALMGSTP